MYTLQFHDIHKEDVAVAGGKCANLGEMTAAGIPVPAGFVLTAEAYRYFIRHNNYTDHFAALLKESGTDEAKLCAAAGKLRALILEGQFPADLAKEVTQSYKELLNDEALTVRDGARVAVRSSATAEDLPDASFAGQQETYLNVRGTKEVLTHIKKCYASLWGDRAVCYRLNQGYDQLSVALAVVIQEMVESEKAGVLFTVNPVTQDSSQMQINASYGLGESVVSGRVTADSVLCNKDGSVVSYEIGSKKTQIITPTFFGEMIYDVTDASMKSLLNPKFTANWEMGLTQVAEGRLSKEEYMQKLTDYIRNRTNLVKQIEHPERIRRSFDAYAPLYRK